MYEVEDLVKNLSLKFGSNRSSLMPILQGIVEKHNYLSDEAMVEVAKTLDISAGKYMGQLRFTLSSIRRYGESM